MAVILRYFTEFGKHAFQHVTAASSCGGIYAGVYCILYHVYDVVVKKVHVRSLISWWVSCYIYIWRYLQMNELSLAGDGVAMTYLPHRPTVYANDSWTAALCHQRTSCHRHSVYTTINQFPWHYKLYYICEFHNIPGSSLATQLFKCKIRGRTVRSALDACPKLNVLYVLS